MQPLLSETKHKITSTLIVTLGALLGFQALSYTFSLYQLNTSLYLSFYIYFFHVFWLMFVFDLHFKNRYVLANFSFGRLWGGLKDRFWYMMSWQHFRHFQNYLVLPGLIYWATVILMFLNPFKSGLKQLIILSATTALAVAYWFMKEHVSRRLEHDHAWIRTLAVVKLFAAFFVYSALLGVTIYFGYGASFLVLATGTLTFLLVYQALFQHRLLNFNVFLWIVIIAISMSLVALWVYSFWNSEYFTGGLVMLAVYNLLWGILHHALDRTLSAKIIVEYVLMAALIISLLLGTHNFNQRII